MLVVNFLTRLKVKPLETQLCALQMTMRFDFKAALERNRIADVMVWERDNLPANLATKWVRVLRLAC